MQPTEQTRQQPKHVTETEQFTRAMETASQIVNLYRSKNEVLRGKLHFWRVLAVVSWVLLAVYFAVRIV